MTRWRFGPVNYGRRLLCRFLCGTAIALTLGAGSQPGQAQTIQSQASEQPRLVQTQPRDFDVPAQPLTSALTAFGDQGGLQVTADTAVLTGLTSQPVSGRMAPEEALARLLAGSGLRYHFTSADTVKLERAAAVPLGELEGGAAQLGTITVEGQREADPSDLPFMTPGSSAYISREQIERIRPSAPGDIFNDVPGVFVGGKQDGNAINVNIRSSQGLNRVRTMVEGTQQESSFGRGYAGADQRTYIDPDLIGGVEISKGPGGGAYSTGTTAGAVNLRLLEAEDLVREGQILGLRLRGGLGGNSISPRDFSSRPIGFNDPIQPELSDGSNALLSEDTWFGSLAVAVKTEQLDLVGAYTRRREGNYFAGRNGDPGTFTPVERGGEVPNTSEDSQSFLFKGALRLDGGHSVEVGYNRFESDFGQGFPSQLVQFPLQQYELSEVETNRYWLRYKWDSDHDLINLQTNIWHTNSEEADQYEFGFVQEDEAWGGEIWNTGFFDTPLGSFTVTAGAEYSRATSPRDLVELRSETFTPIQPPFIELPPDPTVTFSDGDPFFERDVYGAYVNVAFEPTHWLTIHGGLRYDGFKSDSALVDIGGGGDAQEDYALRDQVLNDAINALDGDRDEALRLIDLLNNPRLFLEGTRQDIMREFESSGDRFSPNVGVTVEPVDGLQLFTRYSEGLRAASLAELGRSSTGFPNPDLKPEVLKSWEVGANYLRDGLFFADDLFRAKLVYFQNDYDNFVAREIRLRQPRGLVFINIPDVSTAGYEMSLSYDMGRVYSDFSFSYFTEVIDAPTQISNEQPEYSGTLVLGTRWFDEKLDLGGRMTFFSELDVFNDPDPQVFWPEGANFWPDQRIFDLFASYEVNDHLAFGLSVENVTDRYYLPPLFISRIPAPGRTARLDFTARF